MKALAIWCPWPSLFMYGQRRAKPGPGEYLFDQGVADRNRFNEDRLRRVAQAR